MGVGTEKYKGDALLQKVFTTDFLTKKKKKNEGEVPQYYVTGNHEAIIDPKIFEQVQAEMERRKNQNGRYSGVGLFSSKIKCGECGNWYGSKVWHSNDKYRGKVYLCNHKYKEGAVCQTPRLTEEEIKAAFIKAANQYLSEKDMLLANAEIVRSVAGETAELESRSDTAFAEMNALMEQIQNLIAKNASTPMDQTVYNQRYEKLSEAYEAKKTELHKTQNEISDKMAREAQIRHFIEMMKKTGAIITEFNNGLWAGMVDYITVYSKDKITVTFKDGTEI